MFDFLADLEAAQKKIQSYSRQAEVFRKVVDGMDQGIILTDVHQRVGFVNVFARRLFGQDLTGSTVAQLREFLEIVPGAAGEEALKGEVLVVDKRQGRTTRCFLNVAPFSRDPSEERDLVWSFFELTEEIANIQTLAEFSAELASLNQVLKLRNEEVLRLTKFDPLTGAANRQSILDLLEKGVKFSQSHQQDLSVLLLNVDQMSICNLRCGWKGGDDVLCRMAKTAAQTLGQDATVGRLAGDEFLAVVPGAGGEQARVLAEEVKKAIQRTFPAQDLSLTVTIGVAGWQPGLTAPALIARAEKGLAEGKAAGRNRVVAG